MNALIRVVDPEEQKRKSSRLGESNSIPAVIVDGVILAEEDIAWHGNESNGI